MHRKLLCHLRSITRWLTVPLLGAFAAPVRGAEPTVEVPIAVRVAQGEEGKPVVDEAWVDAQIDEANRLYAGVPLRFRRISFVLSRGYPAHLVTRRDRDALVAPLTPGAVNLRIAASLMDVDEPGRVRRGVHWHLRAAPQRRCIILSAIAGPDILAHELGHYFGNGHSPVPDNLMSYVREGGEVSLNDTQVAQVRRTLRGLLKARALVPRLE